MTARAVDLVVHGGRILTSAREPTFREALAVADDRVAAIGSSEAMRARADAGTAVVDLGGRTVIPGLIDSHMHAVRGGLTWHREVRWDGIPALGEALAELTRAAASRPPGTWIAVLGGWHPAQFAEGRMPTRDDLDRAAPDHPVIVQLLYDGVVLNSAAQALVADVDVDRAGWSAGMRAIQRAVEALGSGGGEEGTRAFLTDLARWGLTGVVDAGGFGMTRDRYGAVFALAEARALPLRLRLFVGAANPGREEEEVEGWLDRMRTAHRDEWLQLAGVGEIAVFGCHDGEGLEPRPFAAEALARLEALTRRVAEEGRPLQLHAILDASIDAILDVWERVDRDQPLAGLRFCLAHVEQITRVNLERAAALGVGIAVQDRLALRAADTAPVWGEEALRAAPPLRTMLDLGLPVAAGTDATRVASPNPWRTIAWLVTGTPLDGGPVRAPEHRLSVAEALEAYTTGSAWLSGEAGDRGRLEPGYRADFAVLSTDCFALPADQLPTVESVLTVVGGTPVHAAEELATLAPAPGGSTPSA